MKYGRDPTLDSPSVAALGGGVVEQVEGQDLAMPNRLALNILMKKVAAVERGQAPVCLFDGSLKLVD